MDYEKKYKDALGWMREVYPNLEGAEREDAEHYFPELRESEDERIRKAIIYNLSNLNIIYNATKEECLAWLEKKKEQKSIQFKDCNLVEIIKGEFEGFRSLLKKRGIDYQPTDSYWESFARLFDSSAREYLKEQKPAEWSEGDEKIITNACEQLNRFADSYRNAGNNTRAREVYAVADKLKSLRPQSQPKWSEEDEANFKWFDKFFRAESVIANGRDIPQDKYLWFKSLRPQKKEDLPKWRMMPLGYEIRPANVCSIAVDVLDVNGKCVGQTGRTVLQRWNEYLFLDDLEKLPKEDEK